MSTANSPGTIRALHIAIHGKRNRNAGDTVLVEYTRKALEAAGEEQGARFDWERRQLWEPTTRADVEAWNAAFDLVLVGGGGLFLRDQAGSDPTASGWQWNCPAPLLEELTVPLAIYGVGYNRFRRQEEFPAPFTEHVRTVARTACFFGLRNSGSIRQLRAYVGPDTDLTLHYCPTTLLHQLAPGDPAESKERSGLPLRVGLNFASDRPELRYPRGENVVLDALASAARLLTDRGSKPLVLCHKEDDAKLAGVLDTARISHEVAMLHEASSGATLQTYRDLDLVVGMRGHAQLIPFGVRKPVISLISHDKLAYFLEDLERPDWGIDVDEPDLRDRLIETVDRGVRDLDELTDDVAALQDGVFRHNLRNDRDLVRSLARSSA